MNTDKGIGIRRCRCFECTEELSFGEESSAFVLFAVISGRIKSLLDGKERLLSENSLIIKPPDSSMLLRLEKGERATLFIAEFFFDEHFSKELAGRAVALGRTKRRYIGEIIKEMSRTGKNDTELCYDKDKKPLQYGADIIIENALSTLLVRIGRDILEDRAESSSEDYVIRNKAQALRRYLYENYKTKITLDSLCFIFRSNKTTICKQFREEYGMTVITYLNRLRVEEAQRLLLEGRMSVTEIADVLGFESIHYFTRFFKKTTGQTPTEYSRIVGQRQKFIENEWRYKE